MKLLSVLFNTVLAVTSLGAFCCLFDPSFDTLEKSMLAYILFVCVFAIYLDYKFRNNQF